MSNRDDVLCGVLFGCFCVALAFAAAFLIGASPSPKQQLHSRIDSMLVVMRQITSDRQLMESPRIYEVSQALMEFHEHMDSVLAELINNQPVRNEHFVIMDAVLKFLQEVVASSKNSTSVQH